MEKFNAVPDRGTFGGSVEVINQNFLLAQQEMEVLQNKCENESARAIEAENSLRQLYNNLQQSQPIPVTELPATGEAGKIYRLAGTTSYADYMYSENDLTTPIKMAEYFNAIDDELNPNSDNLVKNKAVAGVAGHYEDNPEYLSVTTDSDDRVLEGYFKDGTKFTKADVINYGKETKQGPVEFHDKVSLNDTVKFPVADINSEENTEYLEVAIDNDDRVIGGILKDGTFAFQKLEVRDEIKLSPKIERYLKSLFTSTANIGYRFTFVGRGNVLSRYNTQCLCRAGVEYKLTFSSDNFIPADANEDAFGLYLLGGTDSLDRINLAGGRVVPNSLTFKRDKDYIIYGITRLNVGSYIDMVVEAQEETVTSVVNREITKIDETTLFRRIIARNSFFNGTVVSDAKYANTVTDGWDIKESTGDLCIPYLAYTGTSEYDPDAAWAVRLTVCNLCNIHDTKIDVPIFTIGEIVNGETIQSCDHVFSVWTGDDEITVACLLYTDLYPRTGFPGSGAMRARKYTVSTGVLSDIYMCDITAGNLVIEMKNGIAYQSNFEALWQTTGMEHPLGRNGREYDFFVAGSPIRIGDYFYLSMVCGDYSHPLLRTRDLVHYEFVSDIPNSDGLNGHVWSPSEEVSITYYNNRIYALTRGNYNYFIPEAKPSPDAIGWNTILYCDFDNLSSENWSEPVVMEQYSMERNTICGINGLIYTMQGVSPQSSEGVDGEITPRQRKALVIYDRDMNIVRRTILTFTTPMMHPIFKTFHGVILSVQETDLRGKAYTSGGDGRSEVMVTRLDPELLYMACDK